MLPCSQLIYAEVFRDEKLPSWIKAHVNCFTYLDGVPKTIVPDNLKTGVEKTVFYESKVIEEVLGRAVIEQQAYQSYFEILILKGKYSSKRLETACALLLQKQVKSPSYSQMKRILERGEDLKRVESGKEDAKQPKGFQRGSSYYKRG